MKKRGSSSKKAARPVAISAAAATAGPDTAPTVSRLPAFPCEPLLRVEWGVLLLIVVIGLAMRLFNLDFREANLDESYTMRVVRTPLGREFINALFTVDCHPPLGYLFQKIFFWVIPSLVMVRLSSVVAGTLAIPAVFWLVRPYLGRRVALASAFVAATSYILVWYSRVARNYSLFFLFSVLAFGFFIRLLSPPPGSRYRWNMVGFLAAMTAGIYTHQNALLLLPIMALIFWIWEALHRQLRVQFMIHLLLAGLLLTVVALPVLYQLKTWSFDHFSSGRIRPTPDQMIDVLASIGWGSGWRLLVWGGAMLAGLAAVRGRSTGMAVVLLAWIVSPVVFYLLLFGVVPKFMWYFYRYVIFVQAGLAIILGAFAVRLAEWCDGLRPAGRRILPFLGVVAALIGLRVFILWTPYASFYRLKATQHSREQIVATLRRVPFKRVLGDNFYFVTGALREYKPEDIRVVYPPIYNNEADYKKFRVSDFVRESCEANPLLAFFGTGVRFEFSSPVKWEWLEDHYARERQMVNKEGYRLAQLGLNYFTFLDMDGYFNFRLYYNKLEDLPAWYEKRGQALGITYGEGWHPISIFTYPNWKMWYAMERDAEFVLYNAGPSRPVVLAFDVQAGTTNQRLRVRSEAGVIFEQQLEMPTPWVLPLDGQAPVPAYVSFPRLIKDNEGILPYVAGYQFFEGRAGTVPFMIPNGFSRLRVEADDAFGIVIGNPAIQSADEGGSPPSPPGGGGTP